MASTTAAERRTELLEQYRGRFAMSKKLYRRAVNAFPAGVTHVRRYLKPFPIYVDRAQGARKWDVDGNELIDYWCGHGALLLGHCHPRLVEAVREQVGRSTHPGACHELEVRWAELVIDMVPCAERVRFTSSGTEATHMALRLARAFTGRNKVVKFAGHFHGWHNVVAMSVDPPYDGVLVPGIPAETMGDTVVLPPSDTAALEAQIAEGDVACVILEPTGGAYGHVPLKPGFLAELREVTKRHGVVLVFDEIITGFRCAPGGAQEVFGVTPDLTTLGKVLAGGVPGACVTGRAEIMDLLSNETETGRRFSHAGTYNANPLSAAAGVAALELVKTGEPSRQANEAAAALRDGMREVVTRLGVDWLPFGDFSFYHLLTDLDGIKPDRLWEAGPGVLKRKGDPDLPHAFRCGMLLHGVDVPGFRGWVSAMHAREDVEKTLDAFEKTLRIIL